MEENAELNGDNDIYDPEKFNKTWLEGGYLPLTAIRVIGEEPSSLQSKTIDSDANCLVVRTKI